MWTSDDPSLPLNISELNSSSPVYVNVTGPDELTLVITSTPIGSQPVINFTCVSLQSGSNVSVTIAQSTV